MDALAPSSSPVAQVPPAPRSAVAPSATPAPATPPVTAFDAPPPALDSPPPPLSVQREQLRPPVPPLMTGEQMTALLRAVITGTTPTG